MLNNSCKRYTCRNIFRLQMPLLGNFYLIISLLFIHEPTAYQRSLQDFSSVRISRQQNFGRGTSCAVLYLQQGE